ncbi:MAG: hypothetical protein KA099_08915 [Alphaproteobacteria bacterium]|nr:hypothetical protein [Alphaproteobacteria bacterium]MBP7758420.1 hypothetical protein [Alphaproteobacteria bacterium]MBP7762415.1 hypothetical protein [Alphaproteobacteria bacterium]MBP7905431.1 hypothetical protein [Alphaproteobacteria bacterium]
MSEDNFRNSKTTPPESQLAKPVPVSRNKKSKNFHQIFRNRDSVEKNQDNFAATPSKN